MLACESGTDLFPQWLLQMMVGDVSQKDYEKKHAKIYQRCICRNKYLVPVLKTCGKFQDILKEMTGDLDNERMDHVDGVGEKTKCL